ncbi:hypothetical protein [Nonomuraea turcica]|uniref:hypothetical protein n=1 Tax=Nonomuraea sp. G32 TaxID=3067274 RepID=UPI00273B7F83|nr:hypothetical protein [Nonomuraea sp. G32]MDP4500690.1 hypothetical protein [Nonomuraea sp. G32]
MIRNIVAAAAIVAGVTWPVVGATQAKTCGNTGPAMTASDLDCSEGLAGPAAGNPAPGLAGPAAGNPAPGLGDLGGIVATWAMPSPAGPAGLSPVRTRPAGMKDLSTAAHVPALPLLPLAGPAEGIDSR